MATIYKEFELNVDAERVWDALRDFYRVHERLVPGFVTRCVAEPGARQITFANGLTARELLVGMSDSQRRVSYASVGGRATHHQASAQVFPVTASRCRFVWITDVLPDELAAPIEAMMEQGSAIMKRVLEGQPAPSR